MLPSYLPATRSPIPNISCIIRCLIIFLLPAASYLLPTTAFSAAEWSLSVVGGYYLPRLDELNYILKNAAVELGPRNTEAKPVSYPVIYQGFSPDNMPEMKPVSPQAGLQIQADINPHHAIVFGGSIATYDSVKRDVRPFFVGFNIPSDRVTRFSLSLNQFWLGFRRYLTAGAEDKGKKPATTGGLKADKSRFFAEMGIFAITRAYLTTDVWLHVYAPDEGFDFYKVTETGISGSGFAAYLGGGGEYYIKKWLSVGMDIDYMIGNINEMRFAEYFTVDPLEKDIIKRGDIAHYTDLGKGRVVPLTLKLDGWDLKGQLKVYF